MAKVIVAGEIYESITGQLFEIGRQLRQPAGYPFNPERLKKHLQDAIEGKFSKGIMEDIILAKEHIYVISIDYAKSIEEMVKLGKYDWANDDVTAKHFPTKRIGKAEMEIKLFYFDRSISSEDAIKEMDEKGYHPAECCELLVFGAKYPDVQREFPIVALGSVWLNNLGNRLVAVLLRYDSGRDLSLNFFDDDWSGNHRFAAVRKPACR